MSTNFEYLVSIIMGASGSHEIRGELESTPRSLSKTTYAYSTGETYYGGWENNKREGFGTYLYATGDAYSGQWHRNLKSAYGVYIKANHVESYAGEWRQNSRNGRGCLIQKNGTRFIGSFKQDLRHGCGVCVKRTGHVLGEIWRHGQLIHRQYILLCTDADMVTSRRMRFQSVHDDEDGAHIGAPEEVLIQNTEESPDRLHSKSARLVEERIPFEEENNYEHESAPIATARSHVSYAISWTVSDVQILLKYAGLNSLCPRFLDQQVDGLALVSLVSEESFMDSVTLSQLGLTIDSSEYKILLSLVRVITKMKHKCEFATVISFDSLSECFGELELNYDDIDFEYECGRGGYGEVYKANWMHRSVACKVFKSRLGEGATTPGGTLSKDFWLELNALAKLRHPNITLLLGVCLRPRYCIVTEFVSCGSLFDLIHRHREIPNWGVARIISVSKEICVGMTYLHSQGILHCDLKSSNILITDTWGVKIADFGLSFLFPDASGSSDGGSESINQDTAKIPLGCVGTHHWIAPEVLRGEEYSKGADVYSFGIILWEMIHRKIPYHDLSAAQVIALVGYGGKRLRVSSYCPKQVKSIIYMCLNRDHPNQRPSFMTLATELNGLHRLAVLEVEDNLDSFFGSSMTHSGSDYDLNKLDKLCHIRR